MFIENNIGIFSAFLAGLLSFFSPCILPLLPAYIALMSGLSADDIIKKKADFKIKNKTFFAAIAYSSGFSFVFIVFGMIAATFGSNLSQHLGLLKKIGGVLIVFFA